MKKKVLLFIVLVFVLTGCNSAGQQQKINASDEASYLNAISVVLISSDASNDVSSNASSQTNTISKPAIGYKKFDFLVNLNDVRIEKRVVADVKREESYLGKKEFVYKLKNIYYNRYEIDCELSTLAGSFSRFSIGKDTGEGTWEIQKLKKEIYDPLVEQLVKLQDEMPLTPEEELQNKINFMYDAAYRIKDESIWYRNGDKEREEKLTTAEKEAKRIINEYEAGKLTVEKATQLLESEREKYNIP